MLKHEPFGKIRNKYTKNLYQIETLTNAEYFDKNSTTFQIMFDNCEFLDNSPFGIKMKQKID